MSKTVLEVLGAVGGAATLAGGLVYAVVWRGYTTLYGHFGLRPSEVGVGQPDIVRKAALGVLVMVVACAVVLVLAWVAVSLTPSARTREVKATWSLLLLIGLGPVVLMGFSDFAVRPPYLVLVVLAMAAAALTVGYVGHVHQPPWRWSLESVGVSLAGLGVVFLCASVFLNTRADDLARDLLEDGRQDHTTFMFEVRADPVCTGAAGDQGPFLLLGQGEHGPVLFDTGSRRAFRPPEAPDLVFLPDGATC